MSVAYRFLKRSTQDGGLLTGAVPGPCVSSIWRPSHPRRRKCHSFELRSWCQNLHPTLLREYPLHRSCHVQVYPRNTSVALPAGDVTGHADVCSGVHQAGKASLFTKPRRCLTSHATQPRSPPGSPSTLAAAKGTSSCQAPSG